MKRGKRSTALVITGILALGTLTPAFAKEKGDDHFKMMDANGDGKVTRSEHATAASKMFAECDSNRDGIVTVAEMDAAMHARGEKPAKHDKSSAEKIAMIDQNNDGKLTTAEHTTGTEKMFGEMDTNRDGALTKDECDAAMKRMKKDS